MPYDGYAVSSCINTGADLESITADDFECSQTGWITDIEFNGTGGDAIRTFRITFWSDAPATAEEASHPRTAMGGFDADAAHPDDPDHLGWRQISDTGYKINIPREDWFLQEGSPDAPVIYWISIQAIIDPSAPTGEFYWVLRERTETTWGDDAAFASEHYGVDPWGHWGWVDASVPDGYPDCYVGTLPANWAKSADTSFKLSGIPIPEPGIILLVGVGLAALMRRRK